jgi:hypothetical protein
MFQKCSRGIHALNRVLPIRISVVAFAALILVLLPSAKATISATGILTETATSASFNSFSMSIQNTSTAGTSLEMFWFAWVPGQNFLKSDPITVTPPPGWTEVPIGNASIGFSMQFNLSTGTPLAAGASLSGFDFTSPDSLAMMEMDSTIHTSTLTTTSEVGLLPDDNGADSSPFVVTVIPEPSTVALIASAGALGLCLRKTRRRS